MKVLVTLLGCLLSLSGFSQQKISVSLVFRPERAYFQPDESTLNRRPASADAGMGIGAGFQYRFGKNWVASSALAFANRNFNGSTTFNQSAIPPPRRSQTNELVHTRKISYRIVELPFAVSYRVPLGKNGHLSAGAGYVFNYLLNARYLTSFPRYDGTYSKKYLLGGSPFATAGLDCALGENWAATLSCSYVFARFQKPDPFLMRSEEDRVPVSHRYTFAGIGIKRWLR